ncbi:MAG: hypothetical protein J6S60_10200 [Oscillospiraceae bacterium]|nr:hypothetical protein [Oscillospiraceae bacterium]
MITENPGLQQPYIDAILKAKGESIQEALTNPIRIRNPRRGTRNKERHKASLARKRRDRNRAARQSRKAQRRRTA